MLPEIWFLEILPGAFALGSVMGLSWVQWKIFFSFKRHKSAVVGQNIYKDD